MELQDHLEEFRAAGVEVLVVLAEPVDVLASFADANGITYPVLSDEGSKVIREYGILNTLVDPGEDYYGMPWPGSYLTDTEGIVRQKYFHLSHRIRETAPLMLRDLDAEVDLSGYPQAVSGDVSAALDAHDLKPYQQTELLVRLELPEGMHAYGEPAPPGYIPTSVSVSGPEGLVVDEPHFPPTRPLLLEGLNEELAVFEGEVEIRVPLRFEVFGATEGDTATLDVDVRYQPCDDIQCFTPVRERLEIAVTFGENNRWRRS